MASPVSVILPCFNFGRYLPAALDTLYAQTLPPSEIIVVDDGSTDDTAAVCGRYRDVRYHHKLNGGASSARNVGIRLATSPWILFLDADDQLLPGALQQLVEAREQLPEAAAVFGHCELASDDDGQLVRTGQPFPEPSEIEPYVERRISGELALLDPRFAHRQLNNNVILQGCTLVRRDLLLEIGGYDETLQSAEDQDLWLRALPGARLAFLRRTLLLYRKHAGGLTDPSRAIRNVRNVLRVLDRVVKDTSAPRDLRLAARRQYASRSDQLARLLQSAGDASGARAAWLDALRHDPRRWRVPGLLLKTLCGSGTAPSPRGEV